MSFKPASLASRNVFSIPEENPILDCAIKALAIPLEIGTFFNVFMVVPNTPSPRASPPTAGSVSETPLVKAKSTTIPPRIPLVSMIAPCALILEASSPLFFASFLIIFCDWASKIPLTLAL